MVDGTKKSSPTLPARALSEYWLKIASNFIKPPYLNVVSAMVGAASVANPTVQARARLLRFIIIFPLFGLLLCFFKSFYYITSITVKSDA